MFTESERLIYHFHDGEWDRTADPLALEDAYFAALAGIDQAGLDDQLGSPYPPARIAAEERLLPAIRAAFGVEEFDERTGRGLPLAETFGLTRDLFAWKATVRSKYRRLARHVAVYGRDPARPIGYEAFCGLEFNVGRVAAIQGVQVARGIVSALTGKPHPSLIDAMADREDQVGWVRLQVDAERDEAEQMSRIESGKF